MSETFRYELIIIIIIVFENENFIAFFVFLKGYIC